MKGKEESKYPPAEPGELPCWFSRTRTVVRTTQDLAPNSVLRACRNTDRTGSCETGLDARLRDPPALTTAQVTSFQSASSGPRLNVRRDGLPVRQLLFGDLGRLVHGSYFSSSGLFAGASAASAGTAAGGFHSGRWHAPSLRPRFN